MAILCSRMDLDIEDVVILVVVLGIIYYLYSNNATLQTKINTLTDSTNKLQQMLNEANANLAASQQETKTVSDQKDAIIKQVTKTYEDYKAATATILNDAKTTTSPPTVVGNMLKLMDQSVDVMADAIIAYHTSLNSRPELLPILQNIYNGIKAFVKYNQNNFPILLSYLSQNIKQSPNDYVLMLNNLCSNVSSMGYNKILDNLYLSIVGSYNTVSGSTNSISQISTASSPTPIGVVSTVSSPTPIGVVSTSSNNITYGPTMLTIPQVVPTAPLVKPYTVNQVNSGAVAAGSSILESTLNISPYGSVEGMNLIAGLVTFIQTLKNLAKKYCSMNINVSTVESIFTQALQEVYNQYMNFTKGMMLPLYKFVVANN